jgi:hypothetical protein
VSWINFKASVKGDDGFIVFAELEESKPKIVVSSGITFIEQEGSPEAFNPFAVFTESITRNPLIVMSISMVLINANTIFKSTLRIAVFANFVQNNPQIEMSIKMIGINFDASFKGYNGHVALALFEEAHPLEIISFPRPRHPGNSAALVKILLQTALRQLLLDLLPLIVFLPLSLVGNPNSSLVCTTRI